MQIRIIQETEIWSALNLCYQRSMDLVWEVAGSKPDPEGYRKEREKYYQEKLKYDTHAERFKNGQAVIFGAFENQEICGMAELDTGNAQILHMAVKKGLRELEVRQQLLFEMACYAKSRIQRQSFLVEAEPEEEKIYRQLWFAGNPQQVPGGVIYLYKNVDQVLKEGRPKKSRTGLWIGIGIGAMLLVLAVAALGGGMLVRKVSSELRQERVSPNWNGGSGEKDHRYNDDNIYGEDEFEDEFGDEYGDDFTDEEDDTVMSIDEYVADDVAYGTEEQQYQEQSDSNSRFYVYFDIQYPEVKGLSGDVQEKVNRLIKECAMQTEEKYYRNPSEEMKEWMLGQQQPVVMSQVRYKVSYMTNDLICVVFEDSYAAGNVNQVKLDMRAITINVKNGTVYRASDVLDQNKSFTKMWSTSIEENYGGHQLLDDFTADELKKMFEGKFEDQGIREEMILTADGIEIGFTYDYSNEAEESYNGYITMDFDKDELRAYQKEAAFWKMVKE